MDKSASLSCCMICTLADAIKDCPACAFHDALLIKAFLLFLDCFDKEKMK